MCATLFGLRSPRVQCVPTRLHGYLSVSRTGHTAERFSLTKSVRNALYAAALCQLCLSCLITAICSNAEGREHRVDLPEHTDRVSSLHISTLAVCDRCVATPCVYCCMAVLQW